MNPITLWPVLILLVTAVVTDLSNRRIPNWLVLPYLAGGITMTTVSAGVKGLERSLGGVALAITVTGILCWLRGMGMGDLKLCAALGAWIGPAQLGTALIVTGIVGGVMALVWAAWRGWLSQSLDGAGELVSGSLKKGLSPHTTLTLDHPGARTMPYAPAIAVGTVFSFFST
jgi:prepilin peptidase CpaA